MFKKALLALAATTLVASPLVTAQAQAAPPQHRTQERTVVKETVRGPHGRTVTRTVVKQQPQRGRGYANQGHRWNKGQRFDRRYAQNYRVVDYRQYHGRGLYAPPRGYQWAQSGNDAVLIAITSGLIGAVLGGALR